jgi:hypothetical protein
MSVTQAKAMNKTRRAARRQGRSVLFLACGLQRFAALPAGSRLRPPKCGSTRSFAFAAGFGFRRAGMDDLAPVTPESQAISPRVLAPGG